MNIRHYIEMDGKKIPLKKACELKGIKYQTVFFRMYTQGMSLIDAINKPVLIQKKEIPVDKIKDMYKSGLTMKKIAEICGLSVTTVQRAISY